MNMNGCIFNADRMFTISKSQSFEQTLNVITDCSASRWKNMVYGVEKNKRDAKPEEK